jgi:SAM-dependent methyltransferase
VPPYKLMYKLGFAPWEWRDLAETWQPLLEGETARAPGRALDIGCGRGRDAIYLSKRGWTVTGVDFAGEALVKAREQAASEGVKVEWIQADVGQLGQLGLEPGYDLIYDFGCIQGLPDAARQGAANGVTGLASPGAVLLVFAFGPNRQFMLPRGMEEAELVALLGGSWDLEQTRTVVDQHMPGFAQKAKPTVYMFSRRDGAGSGA